MLDPGVVVVAVYPTHVDVCHRPSNKRRQRAEEREAKQAATAVNAENELWKPRLDTLPLFEDLGLEECDIPTLATFFPH